MKTQTLKSTLATFLLTVILFSTYACNSSDKQGEKETNQPFEITIHTAAMTGDVAAMKKFIDAKSDLNEKDPYGATPLSITATFNQPEITKILLEAGADVNTQVADGSTALHVAAFFGREDIVQMILSSGVDTRIRNSFGVTAYESIQGPFESVKMIYDQLAKDLGPLGLKLDYDQIKASRPVISQMIATHQNAR